MEAHTHRPIKGILKNRGSATAGVRVVSKAELDRDRDDDQSKKSQKWDEMNILATYHPSDKDYGLMKIDEPSTPYHRMVDDDDEGAMSDSECNEALTADVLAKKLEAAEGKDPKFLEQEESSEEEDEELTPEEREKKKEFEMRRRHHYNEGMNIKLARQLIAKELAGEDDEDEEDEEMQDVTDTEDASSGGPPKQRLSDSTHPNHFLIRSDPEPVTMYSPEQTSLHERSLGNSRSSTQMNSYSDSGYQEAGTFHNHNVGKPELRQQHSFSGSTSNHLVRSSRAEGQTLVQPSNAVAANRAVRRVSSVPSRSQSPSYVIGSGVSPSRGSLRTCLGSGYGSPSITDSRPPPSAPTYSSTTLPSQRAASPYAVRRSNSPTGVRRIGSLTSRQNSNPNGVTSTYQTLGGTSVRVGSPLTLSESQNRVGTSSQAPIGSSSSPKRAGMTAVPQHMGTLPRNLHDIDQYGPQPFDIYERMVPPRPDSLTGLRSSYASQHSQLGQELRSTVSPDLQITPIYEGRTYYSPVYRNANHGTIELRQGSGTAVYRTASGGCKAILLLLVS